MYFFSHANPRENLDQYRNLVNVAAGKLNQRLKNDVDARASGIIVNSCGWIDGAGYDIILHIITALSIDIVLVMSHDRLHASLVSSLPEVNLI